MMLTVTERVTEEEDWKLVTVLLVQNMQQLDVICWTSYVAHYQFLMLDLQPMVFPDLSATAYLPETGNSLQPTNNKNAFLFKFNLYYASELHFIMKELYFFS